MQNPTTAALQQYDVGVFQHLDAFHSAKKSLAEQEQCITMLGDVICDHNLHKHVGVSLLHKHYSISDEEIVIKYFDDNAAYIKPEHISAMNNELPYIWRVVIEEDAALYFPTEFCRFPADLQRKAEEEIELIRTAERFLVEFAQRLTELELINVFGLATLSSRDALIVDEGWTLLENTDEDQRTLVLKPVLESEVETIDSTQTLWSFTPPDASPEVFAGIRCGVHCVSHCYDHAD
jgi:hypothetical protein